MICHQRENKSRNAQTLLLQCKTQTRLGRAVGTSSCSHTSRVTHDKAVVTVRHDAVLPGAVARTPTVRSTMNPDKPDVDPNSSSEQDISETNTLTGTQDVVRAVFISLTIKGPISTHLPRASMSQILYLCHPRYATHPPTISVYTSNTPRFADSTSSTLLFHQYRRRRHTSSLSPGISLFTRGLVLSLQTYGSPETTS